MKESVYSDNIPTPKLSVALPVYNTDINHLKECIESILVQTFTDFECIVYDDASTVDYIEALVHSYNDPRIQYYRHEHNKGISATRNDIIELARGEYIAVADHDDISLPFRFQKQVDFLDENPEIGIVSSLIESFSTLPPSMKNKKRRKHISGNVEFDDDIKTSLFKRCAILHPASMMRRSLFTTYGIRYEEKFSPAEDYMLWCRCMKFTHFHSLQEVLLFYRIHRHNTSLVQKKQMDTATQHIRHIMKREYSDLYTLSLIKQVAEKLPTKYIRLFGCIPFLKRKRNGKYVCWYLFYHILLFRYKI